MKYPLFSALGDEYPYALEQKYERILKKISELWFDAEIEAYFTSLLIDTRGGRQGFEFEVFQDIQRLHKYHEYFRLTEVADRATALKELQTRQVLFTRQQFIEAVSAGDQSLVDLFIRGGMSPKTTDEKGNSLLLMALRNGFSIVSHILIKAGADVDVSDRLGFTPLLLACGKTTTGYQEIAKTLIHKGADVNVRDPLGWSPLLLAVSNGSIDVARMLLVYGANPKVKTKKGESLTDIAQQFGNSQLLTGIEAFL
ncbi:MAG: hypothetical protein Kow0065_21470 [Methylomicrobium sp.]